jgi:hypothetical protein
VNYTQIKWCHSGQQVTLVVKLIITNMDSIIIISDVKDIDTVFKEILPFLVGLVRCLWKCFSRNDINIMMVARKRLQITLPLKMAPSISAVGGNDIYAGASFRA